MSIIRTVLLTAIACLVTSSALAKTLTITNKLKWNAIIVEESGTWASAVNEPKGSIKIMPGHRLEITVGTDGENWQFHYQISVKKLLGSTLTPICLWSHSPHIEPLGASVTDISGLTYPDGTPQYDCGSLWIPSYLDVAEWPEGIAEERT